ncbi:hypothetical protein [Streptomyces turgidiscabies]|uniref:hypothetical protein n=1 Tax=Streptomyces turgidiscabies TaxID=85558 RepID=UPI0002D5BCC1|nr:hypothetical protein [Streptomyces turgidiscabies]
MPPDDLAPGSARSAAAINDQIRALWLRAGGQLTDGQRREYEALLGEWAEAVRTGVAEAA